MYTFLGITFCSFFIIAGIVFIYGAINRWPMLIDPPDDLWLTYSQAFIKKIFGKTLLVYFTCFLGVLFICAGVFGLWNGLRNQSHKTETGDVFQQKQEH
jgi:uncharacterized membrane protein HdeD (DUF308 family)